MALRQRLRLYVIIDLALLAGRAPGDLALAALRGGASALQLRAKGRPLGEIAAAAGQILPLCAEFAAPLLINDHADLALALGAAGAHLGVDDLPVGLARRILPHGLLGYSPASIADARAALRQGASYLGVGPFAATTTKNDAGPPIGAAGVSRMAGLGAPVVAIGGISLANAAEALEAGACGIAVASSVICAADPEEAARRLARIVDNFSKEPS